MNKKLAQGLAAWGLAACVLPVHALSVARVTIFDPIITVEDLDLGDGIEATYRPGGRRVDAFHYSLGPVAFATRDLVGSAWVDETATSITGAADQPNARFLGIADRWAPSFTFTAAPNTRVTLNVAYSLAGEVSGEPPSGLLPARAGASFELGVVAVNQLLIDPDYGDVIDYNVLMSRYTTATAEWSSDARAAAPQIDGVLSLSFDNLSASEAIFAFRAELVVFGNTSDMVASVPEPSAGLLMFGGLAGLTAWRRRRGISWRS